MLKLDTGTVLALVLVAVHVSTYTTQYSQSSVGIGARSLSLAASAAAVAEAPIAVRAHQLPLRPWLRARALPRVETAHQSLVKVRKTESLKLSPAAARP